METTAQTQTQAKGRKRRPRPSNSPENSGDDGKKRGRPRVEKQDESAADRRRTQIRMAQRAYRQRKESTLDELRKRVSELTNTVELMNKAFLDCQDKLAAAGLPATQLRDIHETSMQYESLMKCVRNPDEDQPPETNSHTQAQSSGSVHGSDSVPQSMDPKNVPSWMDQTTFQNAAKDRSPMEIGMGYTLYMQDSETMDMGADYFSNFNPNSQALVPSQKHPPPHRNHYDAFRIEVPDVTIPMSVDPPRTYSFQESTFARRLHRASLESGYQLLLDPQRCPATYDRVFRLSLMSRDRNKIIAAMKSMLDRGPHESLDSNAPLIHVGGAGTHFPRKDQFGNTIPKKSPWNLGIVGPQTLALLENAARDNLTTDMTVDIAGFEGEWFDSYDVEGYLIEKGIFIDPSSSFAEAEVMVWASQPSDITNSTVTASHSASPRTPQGSYSSSDALQAFDPEQMANLSRLGVDPNELNDFSLADFTGIGYSDASTGSWMNFLQPGESVHHNPVPPEIKTAPDTASKDEAQEAVANVKLSWEGSRTSEYLQELDGAHGRLKMFIGEKADSGVRQQKKAIIIDVAKFVKVLTVSGVCLGRGPGFKRRDVDRALALASFDAF